MLLRKETGGAGVTHGGKTYTWDAGGSVTNVPDDLGHVLLSIRGAGYSIAEPEPAKTETPKPAPAPAKPAAAK